jgi:predicted TIM-barrel enzyme
VLPVIHVETLDQALRNAAIARKAGCAGVFLINHFIHWPELLQIARGVVDEFSGWWVGVNCLGLKPEDVVAQVDPDISGIWADNAGIDEFSANQPEAEKFLQARQEHKWNGLYFGGVAFKYQREVTELEQAAKVAARYIDVVTTSGPGTGKAASREKIAAMKRGLGDAPLAIASGITPENVSDYSDLVTFFLVATGISRSFTELDPERVKALMDAVGQTKGAGSKLASE